MLIYLWSMSPAKEAMYLLYVTVQGGVARRSDSGCVAPSKLGERPETCVYETKKAINDGV